MKRSIRVVLKERLDEERAVVVLSADAEKIGVIADPLRSTCLKPGDHLLMDPKSGYLLERLPKTDVEDLALEEVPDIGYRDVGGLAAQITAWRGLWIPAAASRNLSTRKPGRGTPHTSKLPAELEAECLSPSVAGIERPPATRRSMISLMAQAAASRVGRLSALGRQAKGAF
jgi:hypothetical protein